MQNFSNYNDFRVVNLVRTVLLQRNSFAADGAIRVPTNVD